MIQTARLLTFALVVVSLVASGCSRRRPAVPENRPAPPPTLTPAPPAPATPPPAPQPIAEAEPVTPALDEDEIANRSLEDLNRDSPLRPALFPLDSAELDAEGRSIVTANADVLRKFSSWIITVEGHCDERGTAEYNLALGERRAVAVKTYLVSLGIAPNRIRTVSYGKEFPFDAGHSEAAWTQNRRAHFVITAR